MPKGYFHIRRSGGGGLGPHINFRGKIWVKVPPSSPNKRKNLGSSVITRRKNWRKSLILGSNLKFRGQNLGHLSPIFLEAKFGAPTRISEANFGAKPSDLLIWKYPLSINDFISSPKQSRQSSTTLKFFIYFKRNSLNYHLLNHIRTGLFESV